jgi:hypothetical protein
MPDEAEREAFIQWAEWNRVKLLEHWPEMAGPHVAERFFKDAAEIMPRYDLHLAQLWDYRMALMVRDLIAFHQDRKEAA